MPAEVHSKNVKSLIAALQKQGKGRLSAAKRRTLVREHGTDAICALLAAEHPKWSAEVFESGSAESPWPYPGLSAGELAKRTLGPLVSRLPKVVARLAKAELAVTVHHTSAEACDLGGWFLVYAVPADHGPELWIAGPPESNPEQNFQLEGWTMPTVLHELYAQHHGFGVLCDEFGWTGVDPGVQPASRLSNPAIATLEHDTLKPADLLRFTRGVGEAGESGWCFAQNHPGRKRTKGKTETKTADRGLAICDVDDQFGLLGDPVPFDFWMFLDRYLIGDPDSSLPVAEHY